MSLKPRIDGQDVTEFADVAGVEAPATAESARPLIVVQYRRNWWAPLLTPLILVLIAAGLVKYRSELPDRGVGHRPPHIAPAATAAVVGVEAHRPPSTPLVEPGPLIAHVEEIPPAIDLDATPAAAPVRPRGPSIPLGFVAPPTDRDVDGPEPNRGLAMAGSGEPPTAAAGWPIFLPPAEPAIAESADDGSPEAEARRIRREREELSRVKEQLLEQDRREHEAKGVEEARTAIRQNTADRPGFLRELHAMVGAQGAQAGPSIRALCSRHGRDVPTTSVIRARRIVSTSAAVRLDTAARVDLLRSLAWPEALILEDLARQQEASIGTRNGPRNKDEALVIAARRLLAVPMTAYRPSAAVVAPAGRRLGERH